MKNNFIAIGIGLVTSVVGGYVYAQLIKVNFPFIYFVGAFLVVIPLSVIVYILRGKFFLLFSSSIVGYFPKGQSQYVNKATRSILHSREVAFVGARGMDLIGENSPFSLALRMSKNLSKVDVFLLEPGGKHSRLRSEYLVVERKKYEAECVGVENFIGILKIHDGITINKFSYTTRPILRMIVTDTSAFVSFYISGTRGRELPCWQISKKSTKLFPMLENFIDNLKRDSKHVEFSEKQIAEKTEEEERVVE